MGQRIRHRRTHNNHDRVNDNNPRNNHDDSKPDDECDNKHDFLDHLYNLVSSRIDYDDIIYVDDDTYNDIVDLYACALDNDRIDNDNNYRVHNDNDDRTNNNYPSLNYDRNDTTTSHRCATTYPGDNDMAANHGIHDPNDDAYYHCSRNDCPCNDPGTFHVDLDRILDKHGNTCDHECCDTGTCDCARCDRDCSLCID